MLPALVMLATLPAELKLYAAQLRRKSRRGTLRRIALMLLIQPKMFEGAIWFNVIGGILAVSAITIEWNRDRPRTEGAAST